MYRTIVACLCLLTLNSTSEAQLSKEQVEKINRQAEERQAQDRKDTIARLVEQIAKSTEKDLSPNSSIDYLHHSLNLTAEEGIPIYTRFLKHPHPWVRQCCMRALGDHGAKARTTGPALFAIYTHDQAGFNQDEAILALGKVGYLNDDITAYLRERLTHPDRSIREWHAIRVMPALQSYGSIAKALLPTIRELLGDVHLEVSTRVQAFRALGRVANIASPDAKELATFNSLDLATTDGGYSQLLALEKVLPHDRGTQILLQTLKQPVPKYLRLEIHSLLGRIGHTNAEAVHELFRTLEDRHPTLQSNAHNALFQLKPQGEAILSFLVETLKSNDHSDAQRLATTLLAHYGKRAKPATEAIITRLRQWDERDITDLLHQYLSLLRKIGHDAKPAGRTIATMLARMQFGDVQKYYSVRTRALFVATLTDIGAANEAPTELLGMLRPLANHHYDGVSYMLAARALSVPGNCQKDAVPLLLTALQPKSRWQVPIDTVTLQDGFFVPPPTSSSPQIEAIRALKNLGPLAKEAIPALEKLAAETKSVEPPHTVRGWVSNVQEEIRQALVAIRGPK